MAKKTAETYTTIQGETWDQIALKVYGAEIYADYLMQNNPDLLDILIFSAGTVLKTPELIEAISEDALPWIDKDPTEPSGGIDPYA